MEIKLNEDLIRQNNNLSHFDRGNIIQNDVNVELNKFIKKFDKDNYNNDQKDVYNKRLTVFKDFLEKSYNNILYSESQFVPVTVAGPAKYNYSKYEKVQNRIHNKYQDMNDKIEKFYNNTEKMLKEKIHTKDIIEMYRNGYNDPISSDDPLAKEKLQAKLEYLESNHNKYKEHNKVARKNGEEQLPSYMLSNSNQNIKSVKDRLASLDKMKSVDISGYYFDKGEIDFDKKDNRVKIYFDEIPNQEIRDNLKSHGFKWSPKNEAWQRQLTPNAIYTTKNLFKDIGSLEIKKVTDLELKM